MKINLRKQKKEGLISEDEYFAEWDRINERIQKLHKAIAKGAVLK